jgi:glutamine synthetase adenylyltransferase
VNQLQTIGAIDSGVALELSKIYSYYRQVETGIRIIRNRATNPLVIHKDEIPYLEQIIDHQSNQQFLTTLETIQTCQIRMHEIYQHFF